MRGKIKAGDILLLLTLLTYVDVNLVRCKRSRKIYILALLLNFNTVETKALV